MGRDRRSAWVVLGIVVVAIVLAASSVVLASGTSHLVVADASTGEELVVTDVEDGTTVVLEYQHSVEKTTVRDVYVVDGDELRMTRTEFSSYGWGLPSREAIDGRTANGAFVVAFENRTYDELFVSPGSIAGHTLTVGETTYDLVERSNETTVRIAVTREQSIRHLFAHT